MTEKYTVWQSPVDLQSSYALNRIDDVVGGFYVTLLDQNNDNIKIKIAFQNSIHAHQLFVDENIVNSRKLSLNNADSVFFTVQNSEYLKWLHEQSHEIWQNSVDLHFVIMTKDAIIDIFATEKPHIEIIVIGK